jgi:hypothetical protein
VIDSWTEVGVGGKGRTGVGYRQARHKHTSLPGLSWIIAAEEWAIFAIFLYVCGNMVRAVGPTLLSCQNDTHGLLQESSSKMYRKITQTGPCSALPLDDDQREG